MGRVILLAGLGGGLTAIGAHLVGLPDPWVGMIPGVFAGLIAGGWAARRVSTAGNMRKYLQDAYFMNGLWLTILFAFLTFGPVLDGKPVVLGPNTTTLLAIVLCVTIVLILVGVGRVRRSER